MTNINKAIQNLEKGQLLKITPQGSSMCPFFFGGRDSVYVCKPDFPLKRGDIALFQRKDGTYIIHRVYRVQKQNTNIQYYMLGDNQTWIEGPIFQDMIHGVTAKINRKGRMIDCNKSLSYRLVSHLWLSLRPVRPLFMKIINAYIRNR